MEIKVVDNFLNPLDFQEIKNHTTFPAKWNTQVSDRDRRDHISEFLEIVVSDKDFFNNHIFHKIEKHLDGKYDIERIYFNGQWSGREGQHHRDGCDLTVLFYISDYEFGWGGFTEILTEPNPTVIHPCTNRLLIFPGNIMHKGYSFSYQHCPMRINLAYKLIAK